MGNGTMGSLEGSHHIAIFVEVLGETNVWLGRKQKRTVRNSSELPAAWEVEPVASGQNSWYSRLGRLHQHGKPRRP